MKWDEMKMALERRPEPSHRTYRELLFLVLPSFFFSLGSHSAVKRQGSPPQSSILIPPSSSSSSIIINTTTTTYTTITTHHWHHHYHHTPSPPRKLIRRFGEDRTTGV